MEVGQEVEFVEAASGTGDHRLGEVTAEETELSHEDLRKEVCYKFWRKGTGSHIPFSSSHTPKQQLRRGNWEQRQILEEKDLNMLPSKAMNLG